MYHFGCFSYVQTNATTPSIVGPTMLKRLTGFKLYATTIIINSQQQATTYHNMSHPTMLFVRSCWPKMLRPFARGLSVFGQIFAFTKLHLNTKSPNSCSTLILYYSRISPCGHLTITDTPLMRTRASPPAKRIKKMTETNSRFYGLSLLGTLNLAPEGAAITGVECKLSWNTTLPKKVHSWWIKFWRTFTTTASVHFMWLWCGSVSNKDDTFTNCLKLFAFRRKNSASQPPSWKCPLRRKPLDVCTVYLSMGLGDVIDVFETFFLQVWL